MIGITRTTGSLRRAAAAAGAAALAGLGVVPADVPASVVAVSTVSHVPWGPAAATTSPAVAGVAVTTGVAEAGATSPTHISRRG